MSYINKKIIATLVLVGISGASHAALVIQDACSNIGLNLGTACYMGYNVTGTGSALVHDSCTSAGANCVLGECSSKCMCGPKNDIANLDCSQMDFCTCLSKGEWTKDSTGYEYNSSYCRTNKSCATINAYRCAAGYYGIDGYTMINPSLTNPCKPCPEAVDIKTSGTFSLPIYGTSSAGSARITNCYLPAGTYKDPFGTFTCTENCPYVE